MKILCGLSHGNEVMFLAGTMNSPEPSSSSIAWGSYKVSWKVRLGLDSAISQVWGGGWGVLIW